MKKLFKDFIVDIVVGCFIGFFILHPASMFIQHGWATLTHEAPHFFSTPMVVYFSILGCILGVFSGFFRLKLKQNNILLKDQQKVIETQNLELLDSITYAKQIQQSMLIHIQEIKHHLPECFVLHKPKDIVSGDIYWFKRVGNKKFIAAIDCTGHGVPGAILSMVANDLLNQIITEFKIFSPELILEKLHYLLRATLNQDTSGNQDGMDIALCCIDTKSGSLEYAGANNSLIYFQENKINVIKADRFSIGGFNNCLKFKFTKHSLSSLNSPTNFYIFSDGFKDQFGSNSKGKFKAYRFRELLMKVHNLPSIRQKLELNRAFKSWKNNEPQTDDVLVIGVRF